VPKFVADSSVSPTGLKWAVDPVADVVTTAGDLIYGTAADTVARLGIGTAGQILKVNSGATAPEWGAAAAGGALTLIATNTLSAVTSSSFNNVFTSTYRNYRIIWNITGTTTTANMTMRLRASGSDNSASNYRWSQIYNTSAGNTPIGEKSDGTQTSFAVGFSRTSGNTDWALDVFAPQETSYTTISGQGVSNRISDSTSQFFNFGGGLSVDTAYDGFTILADQDMTGTISVYGYGK